MDERLNLMIPDDRAANAPAKRFELRKEPAGAGLFSMSALPLFIVALGGTLKKMFGDSAEAAEVPERRLVDETTPTAKSDELSANDEEPVPNTNNVVDLADYIKIANAKHSAVFNPSEYNFQASDYELPLQNAGPAPSKNSATDYQQTFFETPLQESGYAPSGESAQSGSSSGGGKSDRTPLADDEDDPEDPNNFNRRPTVNGTVRLNNGLLNTSITIATSELLDGARDPDGDTLTINNLTADSGTVVPLGDGTWQYTPALGGTGPVSFQYSISDGVENVTQTADLEILLPPGESIVGTEDADILLGTPFADVIDSGAGDDSVDAIEGDDVLHGGDGNDHLIGGDGDDAIWGGAGDDILIGGGGNDQLFGDNGDDILYGDAGNDFLSGDAGDDRAHGGDGDDIVDGGLGIDTLSGDAGNDALDGGADDDTLYGGTGADRLLGGTGNDQLFGDEGADILQGGDGDDVASGGDGDDIVAGGGGVDILSGDAGNDILEGGDDDDTLIGGTGADRLDGGAGNDQLFGGDGNDHLRGDGGNDRIEDGHGADIIDGGAGDDWIVLIADSEIDYVVGGDGSDTLDLSDIVFDATIDLPDGWVMIDGVETAQIFEIENVTGGHGRDRLVADSSVNIMVGGDGNDLFVFRSLRALTNDGGPRDHIMDFNIGDRIDLSRVGRDASDFAAIRLFFDDAASTDAREIGAVTFEHQFLFEGEEITVISCSFTDDQESAFELVLHGHHDLTQSDFILNSSVTGQS